MRWAEREREREKLKTHSAEISSKVTGASDQLKYFYESHTKVLVAKVYEKDFDQFGYDPTLLP